MLAVTSGKVLVTGANGFVAAWTIKELLEVGFSIRAAVRNDSKATHLRNIFSTYGDKLEFAIVPDMTAEGAFDDAVAGIDAIVHTASPVNLAADHPDDHIVPAVQGTLGVLRSAMKEASVKRVLYLCSCAAIVDSRNTEPKLYDETCWNEGAVVEVEAKGRGAGQLSKYAASKTIAERRAWAFYEEVKAKGHATWDFVVVNPPWVFGPVLHEVGSEPESMNNSNLFLYKALVKGEFPVTDHSWVDVRDLAHALVLAVTTPAAGGERMLISAGAFRWQDIILTANRLSKKTQPCKEPYDAGAVHARRMNVNKAKEIIGMTTYRSMEETTGDVLKDWEVRGWL